MILTRQERERIVLDLYNQGKNTREIAKQVRMSFSAIGAILKKAEQENETSKERTEKMSQAAQAYKLFSDGKSPVDVAIACYELSKRGWNVLPTSRNARGIDIVIYSQDAVRKYTIQVKALSKRYGSFR
jgi:transposase